MHHSHTHTTRNNNAKHSQHNSPSPTNHHTDIAYWIRHVTNIPDPLIIGDVNAHSTLWYSHTDNHRGQLIFDIISNSEHIIINTDTPTRVPHTILQQATSPAITTIYNDNHIRTKDKLQQNRHTFTNYRKANWKKITTYTETVFSNIQPPPDIHTADTIFTNIILHSNNTKSPKGRYNPHANYFHNT